MKIVVTIISWNDIFSESTNYMYNTETFSGNVILSESIKKHQQHHTGVGVGVGGHYGNWLPQELIHELIIVP